jgi:exosortase/archaeosortase family protein
LERVSATADRSHTFSWLIILAALNAFAGPAIRIVPEHGLAYAIFELFGISAIVWVALAATLGLLRNAAAEPLRPGDRVVAAGIIAAAILPLATASAASLTVLGTYMIATDRSGGDVRRAGVIAVAITGPLLWGRLLLALFSGPLVAADTWLVAQVTGASHAANVLALSDRSGMIAVAPGCSSWQGMSLALLFWVTVNQWFEVSLDRRAIGILAAALAATVTINVLRIGAMIRFPAHLQEIHTGWGWHAAMWSTLIAVTAICLWGARDEVFR